jgi:hypothetical protein
VSRSEEIEFERRTLENELAVGLAERLKDTHPLERRYIARRYADETLPTKWDFDLMESMGGSFRIVLTGYNPFAGDE